MFILKNQFQNSSFSQYCDLGTDHIRVIGSLLDRAKIIKMKSSGMTRFWNS